MTRVELVLATAQLIDAELREARRLEPLMTARLAHDWPPEHHDAGTLQWLRGLAADPASPGWGMYYVVVPEGDARILVGTCGYHGPPQEGTVEVGYSVVPSFQRRGIATAAVRQLVDRAWERGVITVVATTHPHLVPSIGVLEKLGFGRVGGTRGDVVSFALEKPR